LEQWVIITFNATKKAIDDQYRKNYPNAKHIVVVIKDIAEVTAEQYKDASKGFMQIT
jgi:hypothetical protein